MLANLQNDPDAFADNSNLRNSRERDVLVNYPLVLFIDTPSLSDMINSKIGTISIHSNYGVKEQLFIELSKSQH